MLGFCHGGNLPESHDDDDDDDDDGGGDIEGGQSVDIVGCCRGGERSIGKSSSHWCVHCPLPIQLSAKYQMDKIRQFPPASTWRNVKYKLDKIQRLRRLLIYLLLITLLFRK